VTLGRIALWGTLLVTPVWTLATPAIAAADDAVVQPWERLGAGFERIYGFPNLLFHLSAVAVTPPLVYGADEPVQEHFQQHDPLGSALGPVSLWAGGLAPVVVPLSLYGAGLGAENEELATAGAAAIQAVVVQFAVVTTLKWLTDRAGPYPDGDPSKQRWHSSLLRDSKHADDWNFNPFDLDGGLRWPSGHTASNVALVSALYAFYPQKLWIALIGYPTALLIGAGMIEGDYHWLSDVVAGALIGHVIGWAIGREFRETFDARHEGTTAERERLQLAPAPLGFGFAGTF